MPVSPWTALRFHGIASIMLLNYNLKGRLLRLDLGFSQHMRISYISNAIALEEIGHHN